MKLFSLFFITLFILSNLSAQEREKRLVTITQEKFSSGIDLKDITKSELEKISVGLKELGEISQIDIEIGDLFTDTDKVALKKGAEAISDQFLSVVKDIIKLRSLIYRVSIEQQVFSEKDQEILLKSIKSEITFTYHKMVGTLLLVNTNIEDAINACESNACIGTLSSAEREIIAFGEVVNRGFSLNRLNEQNFKFIIENSFNKKVFNDSYQSLNSFEKDSYTKMAQSVYSILLESNNPLSDSLAYGNKYDLPKIEVSPLPDRIAKDSKKTLQEIIKSKMEKRVRSKRKVLFNDLIMCTNGDYNYFFGVIGYTKPWGTCESARTGRSVKVLLKKSVGVGLNYFEQGGYFFYFEGPVNINRENGFNFVGLNSSLHFGVGAELGLFVGGNGALGQLIGVSIGIGSHVAFERIKFKYLPR